MFETPIVSESIREIAPDFRGLSIHVDATGTSVDELDPNILADAYKLVLDGGPSWAEAHLASWAEVYSRFGAKPSRTPCSAQALRKRVLKDGRIPAINPVVDLYNAISLRYALPVGGENYDAYVGCPRLTIADGSEIFDTVMNGEAVIEHPAAGEVVWRDDMGVTCRRWNWRQGTRTRMDAAAGRMWFILESLGTMPREALAEAGETFVDGLQRLMPGAAIETQQVSFTRE
ncbi:B3/B4 domain-containing protein [Aquamicrobium terrae]|uniref:DNA/RNA-binding domain of Phe-tRNA-synthetase-like protein n=1 Tax=Aquamicrobium terrae TaxID=1324945 RepID=A0ABV2N477_9HYPH